MRSTKTRDEAQHDLKIRRLVRAFVQEMQTQEPDFCRESRQEYLRTEIKETQRWNRETELSLFKAIRSGRKRADVEFLVASAAHWSSVAHKRIKKYRSELANRWIMSDKPTHEQVEYARSYPLYRLLNLNPGQKTVCPMHKDRTPSLHLYSGGNGFCFVCNRSIDAIGWLQNEGRTFQTAVKQLQAA